MVDSFSQEDAFHRAFGTGTELLTKDEIAFPFIHIHVSTYDQKLVEIYTEPGFEPAEKLQVDDITAWQLILPLHK